MELVFILLAVFSVPLAAIGSSTWLKYKRMQLEGGGGGGGASIEKRVKELEAHNAELRERVETLETIATGGDARSTGLEGAQKLKELEASIKR